MVDFWEIEVAGVRKNAADWNVEVATRTLQNMAPDQVELRVAREVGYIEPEDLLVTIGDETPITTIAGSNLRGSVNEWGYLQEVVIYRNNARWFTGHITKPATQGDADAEFDTVTISGPWWWLEQIPFQQNWKELDVAASSGSNAVLADGYRSRVLLGMSDGGSLIATGVQIQAILDYAILASAPFSYGAIIPGFTTWTTEVT